MSQVRLLVTGIMNATELFHKDGHSSGVWYCGKCRLSFNHREPAEQCCLPHPCVVCGKPCEKMFYTICNFCQSAQGIAREHERYTKAVKLSEWDGWVYVEGLGFQDGFFAGTDELREHCEEEGVDLTCYAWVCKGIPFAYATIERIVDDIEERAGGEFDMSRVDGVSELDIAIETFNLENSGLLAYEPDFTRCVLLERKP